MDKTNTCDWGTTTSKMLHYHDTEWGVPVHDDRKLFEYLILDAFQAGLSWNTILNKREYFREAFDDFDWNKIAKYSNIKELELMKNEKIIRNKLKIKATITNAQSFMAILDEFKSFDTYIWQFVNHTPIVNKFKTMSDIPATSIEAEKMSKDLKKRGFKFVGPTICYAFMQAAGMVNDHVISCPRHHEVMKEYH